VIKASLLLSLLAAAAPVLAQPLPVIAPVAPTAIPNGADAIETPAEALERDAAEYAPTFDVAPAEALRRLQAQEASVPLVERLAGGYRDRLSGVIIEHRPSYQIVIVVTGEPAPDLLVAIAPFDVPVVVRSGGLATRRAILEAIERHQADIRAALLSPPGMGVDPATGTLLVVASPGDLDGDADRDTIATQLTEIAGVPVRVRTWGDFDANLAVEGGGRVVGHDLDRTGRFVCTAGFVVTDGAQTALSTAAHCPDMLSFVDGSGVDMPLTMIGAWGARYQDVQLHTASAGLQATFRGDSETRARPLVTWRSRESTRAGDIVCHRGQRTGYSCSLVQLVDYAPPGDLCAGPCPATWVAVSGPKCKGGDSGGPVFLGTVAFGLVKGESATNGTCRLYYYMSTDYLPPGWTLLHGQPTGAPAGP
jgi:streptogrisin C